MIGYFTSTKSFTECEEYFFDTVDFHFDLQILPIGTQIND